jgi:hypothetical protein
MSTPRDDRQGELLQRRFAQAIDFRHPLVCGALDWGAWACRFGVPYGAGQPLLAPLAADLQTS